MSAHIPFSFKHLIMKTHMRLKMSCYERQLHERQLHINSVMTNLTILMKVVDIACREKTHISHLLVYTSVC